MTIDNLLRACAIPDGKILVALSGGADSTALLLSLCEKLGAERVCAFHLNHCLRGEESDRDERFCRELCERLGVPFKSERREILAEKQRGETTEQAARRIRYDELTTAAREFGCSAVATAHTANDAAETVLLNLARGAGGAGMGGIPPTRFLDDLLLIRPMLSATRDEVEQFLRERGQNYVEDSSNASDDYSRNILRHHALPALERVNDRAVRHIAASAALAREDEEYLRGEAVWLLQRARMDGAPGFDAELLADAAPPIRRRALRLAFAETDGSRTLERVHVEALERLCAGDSPSARVSLPGDIVARREYERLLFEHSSSTVDNATTDELVLELGENTFGNYKIFVEKATAPTILRSRGFSLENPLFLRADRRYFVRTRKTGDFIRPKGRGIGKSIKKLCVELKLPAAERDLLPLVFAADGDENGGAAAVLGYAPGEGFAASGGQDALCVWAQKL